MIKYIKIINAKNHALKKISQENMLSLNLEEMKTIKKYFRKLKREPTDCELETLAQTWSEHCKHKTITGIIKYTEIKGKKLKVKIYNNLLKETIFRVTEELRKKWCLSVFEDNAGVVELDKERAVCFKVETHNHPSALEPYGGAGTGVGGVIRDILGCGLGAKPILNTDVFCFANPEFPLEKLPESILSPKRVFQGVVSGVRDYANRMGIPTANGAIYFDDDYLYNPLVYCGCVGIMPKKKIFKKVKIGDIILVVGGRTGRDGIHGATFSSTGLNKDSPTSVVQIGNPIVEKKVMDTLLKAQALNLYNAITDCGAGGFSSAVGELGKHLGARVYLEKAPLKYEGLLPWEIWLSESQERMVLAVHKNNLKKILEIFSSENVEASVIGEFTNTKELEVLYRGENICNLDMNFLHDGLPRSKKSAIWQKKKLKEPTLQFTPYILHKSLHHLLSSLNITSKEWVVRQYDHEVQGQTVLKPLQGKNQGPGDACVIWPITSHFTPNTLHDYKGIAVSCGINPRYGKIDAYWMTASVIDEALRNIISVGGDLSHTALLDNFCWGDVENKEELGNLVRSAEACYDIAKIYGTPFISGKDSLNNKYILKLKTISIPETLLISAISILLDIRKCITMELKKSGNLIYLLGETKNELGGSEYYKLFGHLGNNVPMVEPRKARKLMLALQKAIELGLVESCHDCSEGGLAVALAEMSFSGGLGMELHLDKIPHHLTIPPSYKLDSILLFSESNSRFVVEISKENQKRFEQTLKGNIFSKIGEVIKGDEFIILGVNDNIVIKDDINNLRKSHKSGIKL